MPRGPAPRRPLPRMLNPENTPPKSPRARRQRSRTPTEPECETSSESESEGSPDDVRRSPPRRPSPTVSRPQGTSSTADVVKRTPRNTSTPRDQIERPKASPRVPGKQVQHQGNNFVCWVCVAVLVVVGIILGTMHSDAKSVSSPEGQQPQLSKEESILKALGNLGRNIDLIKAKFKGQCLTIWRDLEAGIAEVIRNPRRPTVFLFFSSEEDPMFCLARMIGNASKNALGSEEDLLLSPRDLGDDYGMALVQLKEKIERQKVVIVEHLLDIHPEAMKAFHNLCDRENPLVKEAIYILTMVVDGYKNESLIEFVENQLTLKLRGKVDEEKLQPLITRMTDGPIIHVQPEPGVKSCPLRY
ncbi:uncharacterized protein LOC107044517 isoform X2 [Diachasma alloeum]|nr:uncharacterized protein LOC107044517 isoform X2 [Diachasma alloeum]